MSGWRWVSLKTVLAAHDRALADYEGAEGIRDMGGLESALARPQNLNSYDTPDIASLTASYAIGIAKAHAFVDGNKRTAWTIASSFAWINGYTLVYDKAEAVSVMLRVADGQVTLDQLTEWYRARFRRR